MNIIDWRETNNCPDDAWLIIWFYNILKLIKNLSTQGKSIPVFSIRTCSAGFKFRRRSCFKFW